MSNQTTNGWQRPSDDALTAGCLITPVANVLLLIFVGQTSFNNLINLLFILIGLNLLIILITALRYRALASAIEKTYGLHMVEANKIITAVLDAKQLPFDKNRRDQTIHFTIPPENVTLSLSPYNPDRFLDRNRGNYNYKSTMYNSPYSKVRLSPNTPDNALLIASLCEKLDDAFHPQNQPKDN